MADPREPPSILAPSPDRPGAALKRVRLLCRILDNIGVHALAPGFDIAVSRDGDGLFARATGQERLEIFPEAIDRFFFRAIDAQIEFVREPGSGRAGSLVLHRGGQDLPAPRKP